MSIYTRIKTKLFNKPKAQPEIYSLDCIDYVINALHPEAGYYIDVGSNDPVYNNSTYLLYKKGWKGVCIDPTPGFEDTYRYYRPNDIFINKAVHSSMNTVLLHQYQNSGMNTTNRERAKVIHTKLSGKEWLPNTTPKASTRVESITISDVISTYKPKHVPLSLLCIDVEGDELEVLKSTQLSVNRPWYIVIETLGYDVLNCITSEKTRPKTVNYLLKYGYNPCVFLFQNLVFSDTLNSKVNKR